METAEGPHLVHHSHPQPPPLSASWTRVVHLLQPVNLCWFTLSLQVHSSHWSLLLVLYICKFKKCIMTYIHHCSIRQNSFTALRILCWGPVFELGWVWKSSFLEYIHSLFSTTTRLAHAAFPHPCQISKFQFPSLLPCLPPSPLRSALKVAAFCCCPLELAYGMPGDTSAGFYCRAFKVLAEGRPMSGKHRLVPFYSVSSNSPQCGLKVLCFTHGIVNCHHLSFCFNSPRLHLVRGTTVYGYWK